MWVNNLVTGAEVTVQQVGRLPFPRLARDQTPVISSIPQGPPEHGQELILECRTGSNPGTGCGPKTKTKV